MSNLGELVRQEIERKENENNQLALLKAKSLFRGLPETTVMVWDWYDSPEELRMTNNDDRDFLILSMGTPHWTYKLAVCDEQSFEIGGGFVVTITSHA